MDNGKADDFDIPPSLMNTPVIIRMRVPIVGQGPGGKPDVILPGFGAVIRENLRGALLLSIDGNETLYPKGNIWQIDRSSDLTIVKGPLNLSGIKAKA